ncbi:hypothetical protein KITKAT_43 [Arthrobacter phage Kitkat]|uniref:Uncharacterized protein n=1 Tax=Arthrobacter phage Kitkat TaxID=1796996 RepID=A0A140G6M0_9CAUD|nr:hypothetical protein BJD77_gp043 [Arthrobacter phage Kitkat]AMM44305.1 hypothetical protein KITKAT_43 [Arthrobacter phage Kitkat]
MSQLTAETWAHGLPAWVTPEIAAEAVRRYFTTPAENGKDSPYFTTRHLMFHAQKVHAEVQERRQFEQLHHRLSSAHHPQREIAPKGDQRIRSLRDALNHVGLMKGIEA